MQKRFGWILAVIFALIVVLLFSIKLYAPSGNNNDKNEDNQPQVTHDFNNFKEPETNNNLNHNQNPSSSNFNSEIINHTNNRQPHSQLTINGQTYPNRVYKTLITPNDPLANQWWVSTNNMEQVWDIPAGSYTPTVAIIDTGFALNHQEFTGRWAVNQGESGNTTLENPSNLNCTDQSLPLDKSCNNIDDDYDGTVDNESGNTTLENPSDLNCTDQSLPLDKSCNNIDDDGNSYVDDVSGWDFSNNDASVQAGQINPNGTGTTHGTQTSGILGATGNNSLGIAGVNWHIKILPIQALDDDSYGDSYTVAQSVYYAANQGADIISISLGTSGNDPYLRTAILYALDKGAMVVAASGNDGCNCVSYPANYPEVLAVGAVNPSGSPASFSSYGTNLDVLAPGQSMSSPTYSASNQTSAYATNIAGTSFATPFMAGILAYGKSIEPTAKWEEIIGLLLENSDRKTLTRTSPFSTTLGFGVSNAYNMLSRLITPASFTQRIQLDDLSLGSENIYSCESDITPATNFYQLTKSGVYKYTANLRELSKATQTGWTSKKIGYVCMGLDNDQLDTIRLLNLPAEINNLYIKQ